MFSSKKVLQPFLGSRYTMTSSSDQYYPLAPRPPWAPTSHAQQVQENTVRPTGDHLKGQFIQFESGQWAGRTIRAELRELQHADRGRKYADVDRRTLDPPPVVSLRFFELIHTGIGYEQVELLYEDVQTIGLVCAVELVPVLESNDGHTASNPTFPTQICATENIFSQPYYWSASYQNNLIDCSDMYESKELTNSVIGASPSLHSLHRQVSYGDVAQLTHHALIGSKVVQPRLLKLNNRKTLLFVFSDLAVRKTGFYRLRYRCFDICARTLGCEDVVIQDERCGGKFCIFSTKTFPGLDESTALTKILASQGVPLNVRYEKRRTKRKRRDGNGQRTGERLSAYSASVLRAGCYYSIPEPA